MKKVEKSKIWWDEKEKIVRGQAIGFIDDKIALWLLQETQKMADKHGKKIDWLVDLSQATQSTSSSRRIMAKAAQHPSVRKCSLFGASIFIRTIANFIMAAARQKNARHFDTEEQA